MHSGAFPSICKCWYSIGRGDLAKEGKTRKANRLQLSHTVAAVTAEPRHSNGSKKVAESEVVEKVESDQYLHSSGDDTDNEAVPNDKLAEKELQCRIMQERINSLTKELDYAHLELKQCEFAVDNVKPTDIVFLTGLSSIDVFSAVLARQLDSGSVLITSGWTMVLTNLTGNHVIALSPYSSSLFRMLIKVCI